MKRSGIILFYLCILLIMCRGTDIQFDRPYISSGYVVYDSFFTGEITAQTGYTGEYPFAGLDKESFYTLDGGNTWLPAQQVQEDTGDLSLTIDKGMTLLAAEKTRDGRLAVVAQSYYEKKLSMYLYLICADGSLAGEPKCLYTSTDLTESPSLFCPGIFIQANGNIMVLWGYKWEKQGHYKLYTQLFSSEGDITREAFQIMTTPDEDNSDFTAKAVNNSLVVAWTKVADGNTTLQAQLYDYEGIDITDMISVTAKSGNYAIEKPTITLLNDGNVALHWLNTGSIYCRKYDRNLKPLSGEQKLISGNVLEYNVVPLEDGGYAMAWITSGNRQAQIYLSKWDNDSRSLTQSFIVSGDSGYLLPMLSHQYPYLISQADRTLLCGWVEVNIQTGEYRLETRKFNYDFFQLQSMSLETTGTNTCNLNFHKTSPGSVMMYAAEYDQAAGFNRLKLTEFTGKKKILADGLAPRQDIALGFKVVDPIYGTEWESPVTMYKYADPADGQGGTITYPGGYSRAEEVRIDFSIPPGRYEKAALYFRQATHNCSETGPYTQWMLCKEISPDTTSYIFPVKDGYAYEFYCEVNNYAGLSYRYTSDTTFFCDQSSPSIEIIDRRVEDKTLYLDLNLTDTGSGIDRCFYSLRNGPDIPFQGSQLALPLEDGPNYVKLTCFDKVENQGMRHIFENYEQLIPAIYINGIRNNSSYGGIILFSITSNIPLISKEVLLDDVNLTEDTATPGLYTLNLNNYSEGYHTVKVSGITETDDTVTQSVSFRHLKDIFNILLLSPSNRTYRTGKIPIEYYPVDGIITTEYSLDGAPLQTGNLLSGLSDGPHSFVFYATNTAGIRRSISANFDVKQDLATLDIKTPEAGTIIKEKRIEIQFDTNGDVTYELGSLTGSIHSGDFIPVEVDGEYTLKLIAVHPVSGHETAQVVSFSVDSLVPDITILSPVNKIYGSTEIPLEVLPNKIFSRTNFLLDGRPVNRLSGLNPGSHELIVTGQDSAGRSVSRSVVFTVADLKILFPADNERIISNTTPASLSLKYQADPLFYSVTKALDDERFHNIPLPPPAEGLLLEMPAEDHEIALQGHYHGSFLEKRHWFQIGRKNLITGPGSIDYTYTQLPGDGIYAVTVELNIKNAGQLDIQSPIPVRFTYIPREGDVKVFTKLLPPVESGNRESVQLEPFNARLGDTFLLNIDPEETLEGEFKGDNDYKISFQAGDISAVLPLYDNSTTFLSRVSFLNMLKVETTGPFSRVEIHAGGKVFTDNMAADGFNSFVDMGLLSPDENSIYILGYGENGVLLDSRRYTFTIKEVSQAISGLEFPWSYFGMETGGSEDEIITNRISFKEMGEQLNRLYRKALLSSSGILPVINESGNLIYKLIQRTSSEDWENLSTLINTTDVPVIGGEYKIPNGNNFIQITQLDPTHHTVVIEGVIPLLSEGSAYLERINEVWREIGDIFEEQVNESISLETLIRESLDQLSSEQRFRYSISPALKFGRLLYITQMKNVMAEEKEKSDEDKEEEDKKKSEIEKLFDKLSKEFMQGLRAWIGPMDLVVEAVYFMMIDDHIDIKNNAIQIDASFKTKTVITIEHDLPGSLVIDINSRADFFLNLKTSTDVFTNPDRIWFAGIATIPELQRSILHCSFFWGQVTIHPQHLYIPYNLNIKSTLVYENSRLGVYPAHGHIDVSVNHKARLLDGNLHFWAYLYNWLFGINIFGGDDVEYRGFININGAIKADVVVNSKPEYVFNPDIFTYAYGYLHIDIEERHTRYIGVGPLRIVMERTGWQSSYDEETSGTAGVPYTDSQVQQAVENGTI